MKTFLCVVCLIFLVLILASLCLASPHVSQGYFGDFYPLGMGGYFELQAGLIDPGQNLFTIEERTPGIKGLVLSGYDGPVLTLAALEFYQTDFIYGDLAYLEDSFGDGLDCRGGYLWEEMGVFMALDYLDTTTPTSGSGFILSYGYRFDLGKSNYVALSLDYYGGDYGETYGGEITAKYLSDRVKLSGQAVLYEDQSYFVHGKANFAAGKGLVMGGGLDYQSDGAYRAFAGLTLKDEKLVLDALVNYTSTGTMLYYLSGVGSLSDRIAVGASYLYQDPSGLAALQLEYRLGQGKLGLSYTVPTAGGSTGGILGLGYEVDL